MATLYKYSTGDKVEIEPKNGHNFILKELYQLLECEMIEIVNIVDSENEILIVDEEAKLNPEFLKTYNRDLSNLAGYTLFGNVLRCKRDQIE